MNGSSALTLAIAVLEALPGIITASEQAIALIENTASDLRTMQATDTDPTAAQWEAMAATINTLRGALEAPTNAQASPQG